MPERQSSPGEVTARPETDVTENGNGRAPEGQPPTVAPATGEPATVAGQVAEQVAAEPEAVEPAPAAPADEAPTGDAPVLTGTAAADLARPEVASTAGAGATAPVTTGSGAQQGAAGTPVDPPPAAGNVRPLRAETANAQRPSGAAPSSGPEGAGSTEAAAGRPGGAGRPRANPRDDEQGDESPTVRTPQAGPAAAGPHGAQGGDGSEPGAGNRPPGGARVDGNVARTATGAAPVNGAAPDGTSPGNGVPQSGRTPQANGAQQGSAAAQTGGVPQSGRTQPTNGAQQANGAAPAGGAAQSGRVPQANGAAPAGGAAQSGRASQANGAQQGNGAAPAGGAQQGSGAVPTNGAVQAGGAQQASGTQHANGAQARPGAPSRNGSTGDDTPGDESPTVSVRVPTAPRQGAQNAATQNAATQNAAASNNSASATAPPTAPAAPAARPSSSGTGSWFRPVDADATQVLPRTAPATATTPAPSPVDPPTERIPVAALATAVPPVAPPPVDSPGSAGTAGRPSRRRLLIVGGVLGLLALLYIGDLVLSSGSVPRGVTVAGVKVGGVALAEAEQRLRTEIEPRTTTPVAVTVGEARSEIDPTTAGLTVDWAGTLDQAGSQPLNPITRITSFFTEREIGVVTATEPEALNSALEELAPIVNKAPAEGSVRFQGTTPVPVEPVPGQQLDVAAAADVLQREWAAGGTVALPLVELPTTTTPEDVATAIDEVARPAVSAPVTVVGEDGAQGTLTPQVIASALTFRAESGKLVPELNTSAVTDALKPQLAASERPGRDASLDFSSGSPVVVPSQDGRGVDYDATLKDLLTVLTEGGESRRITAVYADQPAELTTEDLTALGITGVIGEFTTGGFAADSGKNIKRAAEQINGKVVEPGETFSLNAVTNPRNAANGYVEAGIIADGHPSRGIGGGVSQVATTLYNAAYFAGMVDVQHREHSFYISRYPAGREATVFDDVIDVKFRNDNPTGVLIQTVWTPSSLTVRLYGTKRFEVTSTPGPRTNPTEPNTITIPAGEPCSPSQGAPGFTITDTRTLREISTGEVRNETRTVKYNPSPIVVCGG